MSNWFERYFTTCNIGKKDRIIRFIIGSSILGLGIYFQSWWGIFGVFQLATAFTRWCPAYMPFKINTSRNEAG